MSSHDVSESAFYVCTENALGKKFPYFRRKIFGLVDKSAFHVSWGTFLRKFPEKKILFFQILESGTLDGLITTAFHSCRGTYLETKFLGTYVNNRRLSSITVSWSYNVCVPPVQRKSLGSNLLIKQKLLCCCSSMEHSGKKLKFLKILTEKPRVLLPLMHSKCIKKPFGTETEDWFLLNLFNWELRLFNWWWQKCFHVCGGVYERRVIKLSMNFSWFSPEIVGQKCVVITKTFSGFCEGKISRKKCVSSELWVQKLCPMLSKTRNTCAVFLEQKQEAVSYFGYRAKSLQSVLSKVQSNCPESFVGKIFAKLQFFS